MKISRQVVTVPADIAIEKIPSWIRFRLSELNAELDTATFADVRIELTSRMIQRMTQAGVDKVMLQEVNRHTKIQRIIAEEIEEA